MDGPRRRTPLARVGLVGVLLLLAALGVRALAEGSPSSTPPLGERVRQVVVALLVAGAVILMLSAFVFRRRGRMRRPPSAGSRPAWWTPLVTLALLALAIVLTFVVLGHTELTLAGDEPTPTPTPSVSPSPSAGDGRPEPWPLGASLAVVLACVVVAVLIGRSLVARRQAPVFPSADEALPPEPWAALRDAVAVGEVALRDADSPRDAVIACYVAMEACLAQAGTPRRVTDTPEELLARAAAGGLVRSPAAETLTTLFLEARFSTHPMTEAQRGVAAAALDELRADLAPRRRPGDAAARSP